MQELRAEEEVTKDDGKLTDEQIREKYRDDPVGFAWDFFGITLWSRQAEIGRSVAQHMRTAARSGHKVGKTRLAAILGIWWYATRRKARVIGMAPTDRQIKRAFWYEVRELYKLQRARGHDLLPRPALDPATGCRSEDGRELFGFSADNPDNVSGPSGAEMLVIVDEASGVPVPVWMAIRGMLAGGGSVLALGNPTNTSGWFFEAFAKGNWSRFKISSRETPNVVEDRDVIPGLATRKWIDEMVEDHGNNSPEVAVRVDGEFPENVANAVIGLGLKESAIARWADREEPKDGLDLGVDVARFGDDKSVCTARRGYVAYTPKWLEKTHGIKARINGYDSFQVSAMVCEVIKKERRPQERVRIKIDEIGYGSAVVDILVRWKNEKINGLDEFCSVVPINVAHSPDTEDEQEDYFQLRDQLWFHTRDWLMEGGTFDDDPELGRELIAPVYQITSQGKIKVESKNDMKKKIQRSPDSADSLALAIYMGKVTAPVKPKSPAQPMSRWANMPGKGF